LSKSRKMEIEKAKLATVDSMKVEMENKELLIPCK
jgi:hypothetical protein